MTELADDDLTADRARVSSVFLHHPQDWMTAEQVAGHDCGLTCRAVVPALRWLESNKLVDAKLLPAGRWEMLRAYQLTLTGLRELVPAFRRKGWPIPPGPNALVPPEPPTARTPPRPISYFVPKESPWPCQPQRRYG